MNSRTSYAGWWIEQSESAGVYAGRWIEQTGGEEIVSLNPATGQPLGSVMQAAGRL